MTRLRKSASWLVLASLLFSSSRVLAVDILDTAENIFYRPGDQTRMGIEVELKNLSPLEVAKEFRAKMGGTLETEYEDTKTNVIGRDKEGFPIYATKKTKYFIVKGSRIGDVILKPDYNQITDEFKADQDKNVVTEIVTPPIRMAEVEKLDQVLESLKSKGAQGTYPTEAARTDARRTTNPVSTQVNVEWMEGRRENMKPADLVNLLRSYTRPEHREQIEAHLNVPKTRKPYIEIFSDGFMKKLLDPNYNPDFRQLYDDYVYRQSLERLYLERNYARKPSPEELRLIEKGRNAWNMPIEEARKTLIALGDLAVVPKVVKQNPVRISSLLMYLHPDDHMSKLYDATGWAKGRPLIEFREWNNEFSAVSEAKQALGLVEGAKKYGYYDHDKLLASISTMDEKAIQDLRRTVNQNGRQRKSVFRYYLGDPKTVERSDYAEQTRHYRTGVVGFLPYSSYGEAPLTIPGESVVMHRRPQHGNSVLGKHNPGLINANVAQAMENKYTEAVVWQKYAPGAMPQTTSLEKFGRDVERPEKLIERLNRQHPDGWVMKGVWDLGSEKDIITDQTDVVGALKKYDPAAFERNRQDLIRKFADTAPEYIQSELKKDPGYKGWRISQMLSKPELVIIQKKVPIDREFRIEVIAGKVLGGGSTIDRFKYMYETGVDGLSMKDYVPPPRGAAARAEKFAQDAVNRLPPELRGMPFGMDIALLKDGSFAMIESNPGGNSNFLYEEHRESVLKLGKFLDDYPEALKSGKIPAKVAEGMTPEQQMKFLKELFREHGIDSKKQYPGIEFLADHLEDAEFRKAVPRREDYAIVARKPSSPSARPAGRNPLLDQPAPRPLDLALRTEEVRNRTETVSIDEARRAVSDRVRALSAGRSGRDYRLAGVDVFFDEKLPEGIEAQTRLTADREAVLSFRTDQDGRVSREALDEELRHLEQVRKNPEKILAQTRDPARVAAMEAQIKAARGADSLPASGEASHVSSAGKAAVGSGLAQSLMSVIMNKDLKDRDLEGQGGYHFVQGIGDADSVMDLAIKKPIGSRGLQLARSGLGLAARGIGIYGAGMSAVQLHHALAEGDAAAATAAGVKTTVLGGSVARQFAKPVAERVLTEGGLAVARRAGTSGAAKVLGTVTGPVGLTALAVGDMAAMGIEWRAAAYYGSLSNIYSQPQFESLNFGPEFHKSLLTPSGIQGSLKAIHTNVDSDRTARESTFRLESRVLAESVAMREVLGLSTEPLSGDNPATLARHFQGSAAFNPLASNVPTTIESLCKKGELRCKRSEKRYNPGGSSYEVEVTDYSVAMADYILKEKARAKVKFEKEWKEALASGKADADWLAFIQEKEKLEREYGPRLKKEAEARAKDKKIATREESPLQKEYAQKIYEAYGRTIRPGQIAASMLEHAGIGNHATASEKQQLRQSVRKATSGGKPGPEAIRSLQSELVSLESTVLARRTGVPADEIRKDPLPARLAARTRDFREGLSAEGIEVEKLPPGVRGAVDEILRRKLELEARAGLLDDFAPSDRNEIDRANLQLEALLYGIQMGKSDPPMTEARVAENARRFLGAGSKERAAADLAGGAVKELNRSLSPEKSAEQDDPRIAGGRSSKDAARPTPPRPARPAQTPSSSTAR